MPPYRRLPAGPWRTLALALSLALALAALFLAPLVWAPLAVAAPQISDDSSADGEGGAADDRPYLESEDYFDALPFRQLGPVGNRVPAVVGVPGDANTYYAGAASGGIWKTTDGGHQWQPIFDQMHVASIGALAIAPSDPNVVWVGTGEAFIRSNISIGDGIYRSTDAGATWQHSGLEATGRISRIVVHPDDPDIAWVAALGHCYGPQSERGIYRTLDGGATWQQVLFVDENTGASDLVIDPNNPRILFAGTWQFEMDTFGRESGGPGSGLWRSTDGGATWARVEGSGLPPQPWGKVALSMSADDSRRVYALIETSSNRDFAEVGDYAGTLWRSDDGGASWTMVNADNTLHQRPLYYSRLLAAPDDADEVHFMAVQQSLSLDGGVSIRANNSGWDHHDLWIDPRQPDRMISGHDGGVSISTNRGENWYSPQLPIAQMYHVAVDRQVPYFVYGNRQDGAAMRGPSNTLTGGPIPIGAWHSVGGCEVGFTLPDPTDHNRIYAGCYDGILNVYDLRTGHARDISVWPEAAESWPAEDLKYRFQWTFPMAISPHASERDAEGAPRELIVGSHLVHRSRDGGHSWQVISPDLTSNDPALQGRTGGLTLDDAGPSLGPTIFALAYSPLDPGEIWAGTNDGRVQLTRDDGESWLDLTDNLPDLPALGTISNIEPSRHSVGTAYLSVDRHQMGDSTPYVYKTSDHGATWTRIVGGIPESVFAYAHCVREDPTQPGLLYLGTENGLYVSFDEGGSWRPLQSNLPHAPVHWIEIQDHFQDLVIGTYGRGIWVLDDLTPVQQLMSEASASALEEAPVLFAPRPTYRFHRVESPMQHPNDPVAGSNPRYGAALTYHLAEDAEEVALEILDAEGETVRELEDVSTSAGLHRVYWNLRHDSSPEPKLRTKPAENSKVMIPDRGWRSLSDGGPISVLALPGSYTVRLKVTPSTAGDEGADGGEESGEEGEGSPTVIELEQPLELLRDPNASGSEADIRAQFELLWELREMSTRSAELIDEIEWLRKQLDDLRERLGGLDPERGGPPEDAIEAVVEAADTLDQSLQELEGRFFDLRLTGARQDTLRWKRLLWAKISQLAWQVSSADFPPTESQQQVKAVLAERLGTAEQRFAEILGTEIGQLRTLLAEHGLSSGLIVGVAVPDGDPGGDSGGDPRAETGAETEAEAVGAPEPASAEGYSE